MRGFRVQRRRLAALTLAPLAAAVGLFAAAGPASAAVTEVDVTARGHLDVSGEVFEILMEPGVVALVDDATGAITVPRDDVVFRDDPELFDAILHLPINDIDIYGATDFVGAVDLGAGTIALNGEVVVSFSGLGFSDCATAPIPIELRTDPAVGVGRLVAVFALPETANDSSNCTTVDRTLDLPTAAGGTSITLDLGLQGVVLPPSPPPPTDPSAPPPSGSPPVVSPGAVAPGTTRAGSPKTSAPKKSSTTSQAGAAAAAAGNTSTTGYVWRGGDIESDDDLVASPPAGAGPRSPAAPQPAARIGDAGGSSFGPGIVVIVLGAVLGAIALLRSEARRLLRRRQRAAF